MTELEPGSCFLCPPGTPGSVIAEFGELGLQECICGLVYVSPRLNSAAREEIYQQSGYFEGQFGYRSYSDQEPELGAAAERRLDFLEHFVRPEGTLLDVGCAYGYLLERAVRRGWRVRGVELSAHAFREAARRVGPDAVVNAPFESADLPERHFTAILMAHVLEHSPDPLRSLARARDLLRPGGVLFVEVPNFLAVRAYEQGLQQSLLRPQYHLYQFTPATLRRSLDSAGLRVRKVRTAMVDPRAVRKSRLARLVMGRLASGFELSDFPRLGLLKKNLVRFLWQWELARGRGTVIESWSEPRS